MAKVELQEAYDMAKLYDEHRNSIAPSRSPGNFSTFQQLNSNPVSAIPATAHYRMEITLGRDTMNDSTDMIFGFFENKIIGWCASLA